MSERVKRTDPEDARFMRRCLRLARKGMGTVSPNPMVGAVLVRGGQVLATGWHRRPGDLHAEADLLHRLKRSGRKAVGATLYVNLEPCTHQGRTPPCVPAILASGIRRVCIGMRDPDPRVRGRGIAALRKGGTRVDVGVLGEECRRLNEAFVSGVLRGRPRVTLKAAITLDGRIATRTGDSKWITDRAARAEAHRLRSTHDAVLVGAVTVLRDDPRLDVRLVRGRNPVRVVLDGRLRTPPKARMFRGGAPVWIATRRAAPAARAKRLEASGAEILHIPGGRNGVSVRALCQALGSRGIRSLLVEGGGETAAAFLAAQCADEIVAFVAPRIVGGKAAVPMVGGPGAARVRDGIRLSWLSLRRIGDATILACRVHRSR